MNNSKKILIGVVVVISFVVGFIFGKLIDYPKVDKSKLAGTVGRVNNYRNVKVNENDIKLRSELQENKLIQKQYLQYYSFHYTSNLKLANDIDQALNASKLVSEFSSEFKDEIESLTNFNSFLDEARNEILIALSAIKNPSESGENIGSLLNNANNAIAQVSFKEKSVTEFVDALSLFFETNKSSNYLELKKAHDALLVNQIRQAVASNNKPMLKFLDKQKLLTSKDELSQLSSTSKDELTKLAAKDLEELSIIYDQEKLNIYDSEIIGAISDVEKLFCLDAEKLGGIEIEDAEKLGGIEIEDAEKLGIIILDAEKLGRLLDNENLKFFDVEKLGVLWDNEKLGIE